MKCFSTLALLVFVAGQGVWGQLAADLTINNLGCYTDDSSRVLSAEPFLRSDTNSPQWCAEQCIGFTYFGLENGNECFCGDDADYARLGTSTGCNAPCGGQTNATCGGVWSIEVYSYGTSGTTELGVCGVFDGVPSGNGACCTTSCGTCGGANCFDRPGGVDNCCSGPILDDSRLCGIASAPCKFDSSCPRHAKDWPEFSNEIEYELPADNWQLCQEHCTDNSACEGWTFRPANHPSHPKTCQLMSGLTGTFRQSSNDHVSCSTPPCKCQTETTYHGRLNYQTFSNGVIEHYAWRQGIVAYYTWDNVTQANAERWLGWYNQCLQLYEDIQGVQRFYNDPNFGPVRVQNVIDASPMLCGSVNAAGCGNKQRAQVSRGQADSMRNNPTDVGPHWVMLYEMGRGGFDEAFYGRGVFPRDVWDKAFPHMMAGICFHSIGGDEALERTGVTPGNLLNLLNQWEAKNLNWASTFASSGNAQGHNAHDLLAAILTRIHQEEGIGAIKQLTQELAALPLEPTGVAQVELCRFVNATNNAAGGRFNDRLINAWGFPNNC